MFRFFLFCRSVGFMFIFSFLFFLLTAICFLLGEHLHILCRELKDGKIVDKVMTFVQRLTADCHVY